MVINIRTVFKWNMKSVYHPYNNRNVFFYGLVGIDTIYCLAFSSIRQLSPSSPNSRVPDTTPLTLEFPANSSLLMVVAIAPLFPLTCCKNCCHRCTRSVCSPVRFCERERSCSSIPPPACARKSQPHRLVVCPT